MKLIITGEPEIWRQVKGYEGLYLVSSLGRIISMKRPGTQGGVITQEENTGYRRVLLTKNNHKRHVLVHRLVATAFIANPTGLPQVNHIDGNKENNHASNLEWVTRSQNQIHAYTHGLQKVNIDAAHKVRHEQTKRRIIMLDLTGNEIRRFDSISLAAECLGLSDGTHISAVARGKRTKCGGYKWQYA